MINNRFRLFTDNWISRVLRQMRGKGQVCSDQPGLNAITITFNIRRCAYSGWKQRFIPWSQSWRDVFPSSSSTLHPLQDQHAFMPSTPRLPAQPPLPKHCGDLKPGYQERSRAQLLWCNLNVSEAWDKTPTCLCSTLGVHPSISRATHQCWREFQASTAISITIHPEEMMWVVWQNCKI